MQQAKKESKNALFNYETDQMKKYPRITIISLLTLFICIVSFGYQNIKQDETPITLKEFNKRIANKNKLVLVYFSADWCTVCAKMKPVMEGIEKDFSSKVEVLRIDTERDKEVTKEFEVDALPIMILYKGGCREWIYVGLIDNKALRAKIEVY